MTDPVAALREGLRDRYAFERELGRGGMATVYLARDIRLDRLVAIKVLLPELAVRPELRERFLRETRTAASFSHPNIVPVHAVEETPTLLFFDGNGRQVLRIDGYYPPAKFLSALRYVGDDLAANEPFAAYLARTGPGKAAAGALQGQSFFERPPYDLRAGGKPIAVFFEQADCPACAELHRDVFAQPATREQLARFRVIQLDRWGDTPVTTPQGEQLSARAWADRLGVAYAPTAVFLDGGREVMRIDAMLKGFHVQSVMDYVASGAYKEQPSFQRYIQARADRLREAGANVDLWK